MKISPRQIIALCLAFVLGIVSLRAAWLSFYTIESGTRGIVTTFGKVTAIDGEGLHFKLPWAQWVQTADIRTQKAHAPANAGTKDMQRVATAVSVNYHVDADKLAVIYANTGLDVEGKIIDPRIQEVVKAVVARYSADNLLAQREGVKSEIASGLKSTTAPYHVIIEDVQITDFSFSDSYDAAIEAKQTAEQNALRAKNDLERIKVEAEQKIATARAEAEAIKIQSEAVRAQGGKEYVQMKAIEKWNGYLPHYVGGNGPLPFIDASIK